MADKYDNIDEAVRELSDEELAGMAGGKKVLCPKGTRRVCATRDGKYSCLCEPIVKPSTETPSAETLS